MVNELFANDAGEIRDIIIAPPPAPLSFEVNSSVVHGCENTKDSNNSLLRKKLGNKSPSQLLHRIRQLLANATIDGALFHQLSLQRLPSNVRMMLASTDSATLRDLAKLDDRTFGALQVHPQR